MYIERVPNRNSPPAVLLRESYREEKKVRKRTLANLSKLPNTAIDGLQVLLKGGQAIESLPEAFKIIRSRPHGHVTAVLGTLKNLGLHSLINEAQTREARGSPVLWDIIFSYLISKLITFIAKIESF